MVWELLKDRGIRSETEREHCVSCACRNATGLGLEVWEAKKCLTGVPADASS